MPDSLGTMYPGPAPRGKATTPKWVQGIPGILRSMMFGAGRTAIAGGGKFPEADLDALSRVAQPQPTAQLLARTPDMPSPVDQVMQLHRGLYQATKGLARKPAQPVQGGVGQGGVAGLTTPGVGNYLWQGLRARAGVPFFMGTAGMGQAPAQPLGLGRPGTATMQNLQAAEGEYDSNRTAGLSPVHAGQFPSIPGGAMRLNQLRGLVQQMQTSPGSAGAAAGMTSAPTRPGMYAAGLMTARENNVPGGGLLTDDQAGFRYGRGADAWMPNTTVGGLYGQKQEMPMAIAGTGGRPSLTGPAADRLANERHIAMQLAQRGAAQEAAEREAAETAHYNAMQEANKRTDLVGRIMERKGNIYYDPLTNTVRPSATRKEDMGRQGLLDKPTAEELAANRESYLTRRGAEMSSRRARVEANAQQDKQDRRARLSARDQGPDPMSFIAARNPALAMKLARENREVDIAAAEAKNRGVQLGNEHNRLRQKDRVEGLAAAGPLLQAAGEARTAGDEQTALQLEGVAQGLMGGQGGPLTPQAAEPKSGLASLGQQFREELAGTPPDQWVRKIRLRKPGISDDEVQQILQELSGRSNATTYDPEGVSLGGATATNFFLPSYLMENWRRFTSPESAGMPLAPGLTGIAQRMLGF